MSNHEKPSIKRAAFIQPASDLGGGAYYNAAILRHLDRAAYDPIFAAAGNGGAFDVMKAINVPTVSLPIEYRWSQFFSSCRALASWTKKEKIDIVYAHTLRAGFLAAAAKPFGGFRLAYCGHGWRFMQKTSGLKKAIFYLLDLFACSMADVVILEGETQKKDALRFKLCPAQKIMIARTHLNIPSVVRKEQSDGHPIVATIGRIAFQKDPIGFATIAAKVLKEKPDTQFIWAGEGEMKDEFVVELRRLGIEKNVDLIGQVAHDQILGVLGKADVFLLTSFFEGLPATLLEAMAVGVPVVAADVGSVAEAVIPGETGALYVPPDYETAAQAVLAALAMNSEEKLSLAARERALIEKYFAPESGLARETEAAFQSILM